MDITNDNLFMVRGDDDSFTVSRPGLPFQEGDTVYFTVKSSPLHTSPILQKIITDFVDGEAVIYVASQDTKGMDYGYYYYDVRLVTSDNKIHTVMGPAWFVLKEEITFI